MEINRQDLAVHLAVIILFPAASTLISRSSGTAFLLSLIVILGYDIYRNILTVKETAIAAGTFIVSGLTISAISKVLVYSELCNLAGSATETGTTDAAGGAINALPSSKEVCLSIPEIFIQNITYNPVATASFWIPTIAISAAAVYIYRKYR